MFSRIALTVAVIISLCCLPGKASDTGEQVKVVVVPSRYMLVKLGFDLAGMRSVKLMSYHDKTTTSETLLYEWNRRLKAWDPVDLSVYRSGDAVESRGSTLVVLIGSDKQVPSGLINGSSWADTVVRIESLDMVTLANSLDRIFRFTSAEWRGLAQKYGLELKDLNENLRRWGKYGKPGTENKKSQVDSIIQENTMQQTETETIAPEASVDEAQPVVFVEEKVDNSVVEEQDTQPEKGTASIEAAASEDTIAPEDK